ncbi:MAG: 3-dehydroquinate synthase [Chloroflexi bacterium]|nr:3-dehydroquinate synthase [Chloroflexota bacterium]MCL5075230.1 3-dehydroquinate synthase [Chloroflexota bacterium]
MTVFDVDLPQGGYKVYVGKGLLAQLGELLHQHQLGKNVAIITNPIVASLYRTNVEQSLRQAGFHPNFCEVPDGEKHKNLTTTTQLYDRFLALRLDRTATALALGGGVIGDLAGFVAATYMRGLPFVQVPTTLLAQVDASIGGKVAIDYGGSKNIIGAFYQPRLVVTDPNVLQTLPPQEWRCGMAEVIKSAVIQSSALFEHLERQGHEPLEDVIRETVAIKVKVVTTDPFERDLRAILNFGHTIGHALETATSFRLRHGEAVSIGMVAAAQIAQEMHLCPPDVEGRLRRLLLQFDLPVSISVDPHTVWEAMAVDKKRREGKLRFILPKRIGEVVITDDVPEDIIQRCLHRIALKGGNSSA